MIFIMLSAMPLHSAFVDAAAETRRIGDDSFSISLPYMRISLDAGPLTVGEIDRRGLFRTLSSLHDGRNELTLEASSFRSDGWRSGAVVEAGPLSIGASLNDRAAVAVSLSYDYMDIAVLYAFPGEDEGRFMEDRKSGESQSVLYGGASFSWWIFSGAGIVSFSPDFGFDGFISLTAEYGKYSLSLAVGSPPVLYDDSPRFMYSASGSIGADGFLSEFSFRIGGDPVFSDEYRTYEADIKSKLELYGITIYSSMEYSFSRRGMSSKSDRFTVEAFGIRLGYDSDYGLVAVYDAGAVEFGYDEGSFFASLEFEAFGEHSRMRLRLSSDSAIDVSISLDL